MTDAVTPLVPDEVRVYYATSEAVADPARAEHCRAMLSQEERERHARFHFEEDRHSYLVAHALTRGLLEALTGTPAPQLRFEVGARGRPELITVGSHPRLRFNLSHTRGLVACAVMLERDVGVDVERLERRVDIDQLARTVFSTAEREALDHLDAQQKRKRFFELWTLKEAYIKAVGLGLALPLRSITLTLQPGEQPHIDLAPPIDDDGAHWWFDVQSVVPGFMLAVAAKAAAPRLSVQELLPPWRKR